MTMLVSTRDLTGKGYSVGPNQRFTVEDDVAESLISRGLAVPYREPVNRSKYTVPPQVLGNLEGAAYQTKDVTPERRERARR